MATKTDRTVWAVTYDLLRSLELTTIFGNPGSTEQPFPTNFPSDFQYVLGLQEATIIAAVGASTSSVTIHVALPTRL